MKGLSIITNFGCDNACEYCIWKQHELRDHYTSLHSTNWEKLYEFVVSSEDKISLSGGGDPFYKFENNMDWYKKLFQLCYKKIDVHTSKIITDFDFLTAFNRIVLHINPWFYNLDVLKQYKNKLRLVCVITEELTKEKIDEIIEASDELNCQVSFRELYDKTSPKELMEYVNQQPKAKLIKQNDYNLYFMPDNSIREKFI